MFNLSIKKGALQFNILPITVSKWVHSRVDTCIYQLRVNLSLPSLPSDHLWWLPSEDTPKAIDRSLSVACWSGSQIAARFDNKCSRYLSWRGMGQV